MNWCCGNSPGIHIVFSHAFLITFILASLFVLLRYLLALFIWLIFNKMSHAVPHYSVILKSVQLGCPPEGGRERDVVTCHSFGVWHLSHSILCCLLFPKNIFHFHLDLICFCCFLRRLWPLWSAVFNGSAVENFALTSVLSTVHMWPTQSVSRRGILALNSKNTSQSPPPPPPVLSYDWQPQKFPRLALLFVVVPRAGLLPTHDLPFGTHPDQQQQHEEQQQQPRHPAACSR